jgi:hypothetical protein
MMSHTRNEAIRAELGITVGPNEEELKEIAKMFANNAQKTNSEALSIYTDR